MASPGGAFVPHTPRVRDFRCTAVCADRRSWRTQGSTGSQATFQRLQTETNLAVQKIQGDCKAKRGEVRGFGWPLHASVCVHSLPACGSSAALGCGACPGAERHAADAGVINPMKSCMHAAGRGHAHDLRDSRALLASKAVRWGTGELRRAVFGCPGVDGVVVPS